MVKNSKYLLISLVFLVAFLMLVLVYSSSNYKKIENSAVVNESLLAYKIAVQQQNISNGLKTMQALKSNISNLTSQIKVLESKEIAYQKSDDNYSISNYKEEVSSMNNSILAMKSKLNSLNISYNSVYSAYTALQGSIGTLLGKISIKNSIITNLTASLNKTSVNLAYYMNETKNLNNSLHNMTYEIKSLNSEINSLNESVSQYKNESNYYLNKSSSYNESLNELRHQLYLQNFVPKSYSNLSGSSIKGFNASSIGIGNSSILLTGIGLSGKNEAFVYSLSNKSLDNISRKLTNGSYKFVSSAYNGTGFLMLAALKSKANIFYYNGNNVTNITSELGNYSDFTPTSIDSYNRSYIVYGYFIPSQSPPNPQFKPVVISYNQRSGVTNLTSLFSKNIGKNGFYINSSVSFRQNYYLLGGSFKSGPGNSESELIYYNESNNSFYNLDTLFTIYNDNVSMGFNGVNLVIFNSYKPTPLPPGSSNLIVNKSYLFNPSSYSNTNITDAAKQIFDLRIKGNLIWYKNSYLALVVNKTSSSIVNITG